MRLSIAERPDEDQAFQVIRTFIEQGGNFIDTADVYCLDDTERGHNERFIDQTLKKLGVRNEVIVATKGGMYRPRGEWLIDARPKVLRESCERSLKHLQQDTLFLYYLHTVDPKVPFEDSLGELVRLKEEGKIRYIGLSNVSLEELQRGMALTEIACVQNQFNLSQRDDLDNGLIEFCREQKINYIPYRPLGGRIDQQALKQSDFLSQLADQYHCSIQQLMLAWMLQLGDHIIPIPGTTSPDHLTELMKTTHILLKPKDALTIEHFQT